MPALKDRHLVVSRSKDHREIYETVSEWLNTTNYFKWTDDSVTYNDELEGGRAETAPAAAAAQD